jgi:MerR family transcriptional regulator/heat shock protein HspR
MPTNFVRLEEVCVRLSIDDTLLREVCDEGLVEITVVDNDRVISPEDAERLRLITVLVRDMDVNLAGVEVILHLREDLRARQRQFDEVLRALVDALRQRLNR